MRFLLDTSTVSLLLRGGQPRLRRRVSQVAMHELCVSTVTEGELRYGLARRGHPAGLTRLVDDCLLRLRAVPWTSEVATTYGELRAECESRGVTLSPLDMMIAAHARALGATLVSADRAFQQISRQIRVQDWSG